MADRRARKVYRDHRDRHRRAPGAAACDCTTRQHKTHITDAVELLYPWHPWASRPVFVHRTVNKAAEAMFHCSLDSTSAGRLLQIPQWMFDAATMCGIRLSPSPVVDAGSLRELKDLLSATNTDSVVQGQHLSVDDARLFVAAI